MPQEADLLLTGARVHTMNAAHPRAEAVAIKDGRIVAVGTSSAANEWRGPRTEVIALDGCMLLPGFQDAHIHAIHGGIVQSQCDLHDVGGVDNYLERIARYAAGHPAEPWIVGGGWSMDDFPGGTPHRSLLDRVVPDRPVFLPNRDWHGAWVNSRALQLAHIDRATPDPSGGRIERDPDGEPSGTLHEHAMDLVESLIPAPTREQREEGLRLAQRQLHAFGVTSWQDAMVEDDELDAYLALAGRGELNTRVVLSLLWHRDSDEDQLEKLIERRDRAHAGGLRANTVKIFQDGVVENYTAAMLEPYLDGSGTETDNAGMSMIEPEALKRYVTLLDATGFQVHFHAIGDRAVREALDAVEAAQRLNGMRDLRHHIAHIQVIHPDDIPRFASLAVVANAQPFWACMEAQMRDLTIPFLGPERSRHQYPFASLLRAGATVAFGSDWPVSTPNPLWEIEVAVSRIPIEDRSVAPFLPQEGVALHDALVAFTRGSAFVNHQETETGSIEVGKLADLVAVDRDLFEAEPIAEAHVVLTLVDGRPVYASPTLDL
jgi:predicted amidohydrolase YtcJ